MHRALRPYAAGVALVGASLIAVTPVTAPSPGVPHVYVPAIQLTSNDPNAILENLISTLDTNLNSDLSTLEIEVTNGFSALESDVTSGLSTLDSDLGLTGALSTDLFHLGNDVDTELALLNANLLDGFTNATTELTDIAQELGSGGAIDGDLNTIYIQLGGELGTIDVQLQDITEVLLNMCASACAGM